MLTYSVTASACVVAETSIKPKRHLAGVVLVVVPEQLLVAVYNFFDVDENVFM